MSDDEEPPPTRVVVTDVRLPMDAVLRLTLQVMWVGFLLGLVIGMVWWIVQAAMSGGAPY